MNVIIPLSIGGEPAPTRVLFVDDEAPVLTAIARMLRRHRNEFDVRGVTTARDAITTAREWRPSVIVSDVAMPKRSGLDLLSDIQADSELNVIPVIMLTGSADADLKRRALDRGAVDLLNKPVQTLDLVARLRSVVRLRRQDDYIRGENERLRDQVRRRTAELEQSHNELVFRLALAAEFRDQETGAHICRVAHASVVIARALGYHDEFLDLLLPAAALHDIGKIGIPDAILLKPGRLTAEERRVMETHCRIGWRLLQCQAAPNLVIGSVVPVAIRAFDTPPNRLVNRAAAVALSHHEWWNGSGYPSGLRGEAIPLEARIVAVADVFEALCHERPYKPPMPAPLAMRQILEGAGTQFDPTLVAAFESVVDDITDVFNRFRETTLDSAGEAA